MLNQYLTAGVKTLTHDAASNLTHAADSNLTSDLPAAGRRGRNFTWTAGRERDSAEMEQALLASAGPNGRAPLGRTFGNLVAVYNAASSNTLLKTHTWGLDLSGSLQGRGRRRRPDRRKRTQRNPRRNLPLHLPTTPTGNVTEVLKKNPGSLLAGSLAGPLRIRPLRQYHPLHRNLRQRQPLPLQHKVLGRGDGPSTTTATATTTPPLADGHLETRLKKMVG